MIGGKECVGRLEDRREEERRWGLRAGVGEMEKGGAVAQQ